MQAGRLYGTTGFNGGYGQGTVFELEGLFPRQLTQIGQP